MQSEDKPNKQKNPKNKKKKNLKKFHASLIEQSSTAGKTMPQRLHNDSKKAHSGSFKESQFALPGKILKAAMTLPLEDSESCYDPSHNVDCDRTDPAQRFSPW